MTLHFYQPPTQELEITKAILESCYLPLLKMLSKKSQFGLTFNISGSLLLQLKQLQAYDFFDLTKKLIKEEKIEIVTSVMYHPLLPLIPKDVAKRQIEKNSQIIKDLLGVSKTAGFFPPELAIDNDSLAYIDSAYIFIDETSIERKSTLQKPILKLGEKYLLINNRKICDMLRSYPTELSIKTVTDFVEKTTYENLLVTVNDAELFGHHYAERLQVLSDLLDSPNIRWLRASDALAKFRNRVPTISHIKASTWQDGRKFTLWSKNPLQKKYLQLLQVIYKIISNTTNTNALDLFDQGTSSCYLYWLSNWPWWHPGLVQSGYLQLLASVGDLPISKKDTERIKTLSTDFLKDMWEYHWSGKVNETYKKWERGSEGENR